MLVYIGIAIIIIGIVMRLVVACRAERRLRREGRTFTSRAELRGRYRVARFWPILVMAVGIIVILLASTVAG